MAERGIEVVVRFPPEIVGDVQGPALLLLERTLRGMTGLDVRVTKDLMGDDSKLRRMMTKEMRDRL